MVPEGGFATIAVAEPAGWVVTLKDLLEATPDEHEYAMASLMPTSATFGWQEISALRLAVVLGMHCQPTTHGPL